MNNSKFDDLIKKTYIYFFNAWKSIFRHLRPSETKTLMVFSLIIGSVNGFIAFLFHWLIHFLGVYLFGFSKIVFPFLGAYYIVLVPALGGLLAGPLIFFFSPESKGHGVPEVMYAVRFLGGKIRPIVAIMKSLTAGLTIGSGGSAGTEGPVVQIGAAFASMMGQIFKLPKSYLKTLVGAGVAGGIAATFNAPIGGVLFALEVVLKDFAAQAFAMVVLSSVTASVVAKYLLGDRVFIKVPAYQLNHGWELIFYFILGILAGVVARIFIIFMYKVEDQFDKLNNVHSALKPMIGGFLVGFIGLLFVLLGTGHDAVLGTGHDVLEKILWQDAPLYLVAMLMLAKIVATSLSLGSGGSGGIMTPSLFIGGMLGTAYGTIIKGVFPLIAEPGAYGLVGMGAVFAGVTHAPMTAVIMIFEFTKNYYIILPLMLTTVVAMLISYRFSKESMYTAKLLKKGIVLDNKPELEVLGTMMVKDVMKTEVETLNENTNLAELIEIIENTPHSGFPVVNINNELTGLVTYDEIHTILGNQSIPPQLIIVKDLMRTNPPFVYPDSSLSEAIKQLNFQQIDRVVVVDSSDNKKIVGIVTKSDIFSVYKIA
ncbi:MAG: chloride channel protein [bacterium]